MEENAKNKRKWVGDHGGSFSQNKEHRVIRTHVVGPSNNKVDAGKLPHCNRCKLHHNGSCTAKCTNCKRVGYLTRDYRGPAATNNQRAPMAKQKTEVTCYECGRLGHYKSDCPKWKNHNQANKQWKEENVENENLHRIDKVMLKVSPWKGVIPFGKRGKLISRYIGPFKVLAKVGTVSYRLEIPQQLSKVHDTFHVSNLKKCLSDESLVILLDEVQIDDKLHFVEEPIKIMDREVKRLNQSRIPFFKVQWNSRRGTKFTWEHEDQFQKKYQHLFAESAPSSNTPT
ncbi:putative reverse transcriptase domain-containing protein [Tanacetum coccineum]